MSATEMEYIETDSEYIPLDNNETVEWDNNDDSDVHWDQESIKMLLNLYLENVEKFRNPKVRKKSIWADIGKSLGKAPFSCDKKFRNLKQTYIRLLKKKSTNSSANVKWPYFDVFEEIFSENGEYDNYIRQKLDEGTGELAKALLSMNSSPKLETAPDNGESSNAQSGEVKRKLRRKRYADFKKVTQEMKDRQRAIEEKLDKLINIVEESNNIQRERNLLFEQFLEKMNQR